MPALQPSQEILTIVEVKELTGFSRTSIWRLRKSGQLPTYKVNSRPYFKRSDVMNLIESTRVEREQVDSSIAELKAMKKMLREAKMIKDPAEQILALLEISKIGERGNIVSETSQAA